MSKHEENFKEVLIKGLSLLVILSALALNQGCAREQVATIKNGTSCSVTQQSGGSLIACTDGTGSFVPNGTNGSSGTNGTNGSSGTNGVDGASIGLVSLAASSTQCATGGFINTFFKDVNNNGTLDSGEIVFATQKLCNGTNGSNGANGVNGHSAAIKTTAADHTACSNGGSVISLGDDLNNNGVLDVSEVTNVVVVCNGSNGSPGHDGTNGLNGTNGTNGTNGRDAPIAQFQPVLPITPCGANSSQYKEVLLGLAGGQILSEFSGSATNADLVRNTLIPDGSYIDTDDSGCYFSVTTDGAGNRAVTWNGSTSNHAGPFHAGQATYTASTQSWAVTY